MNIALPRDLPEYVESLEKTGSYAGSSDVVQEALRQDRINRPSFAVVMTPELERLLDDGMQDLDQAKTTEQLRQHR